MVTTRKNPTFGRNESLNDDPLAKGLAMAMEPKYEQILRVETLNEALEWVAQKGMLRELLSEVLELVLREVLRSACRWSCRKKYGSW